jgi:hypothetical protein
MANQLIDLLGEDYSREGLKRAEEHSNPLYVWEMITQFAGLSSRARARDPHAMAELPNWVVWYLCRAAYQLLVMGRGYAKDNKKHPGGVPAAGDETITPAEALSETLRALSLVRPGWNAFAAYRRDQLREIAAECLEFDMSPADVRRYLGVKTDRSLRRELAKQRRKPLSHNGFRTNGLKRN